VTVGELQVRTLFDHGSLRQRLRDVGIVLLACEPSGALVGRPSPGGDWLTDLLCASPLFGRALCRTAQQWSGQPVPESIEALPGLWLAPTAILTRRHVAGYSVAVIPTTKLLLSEELYAMCQSAQLDHELCRRLLSQLPLAAECDVNRLAAMVRYVRDDQVQLQARGSELETLGQQLAESYEEINLLYTIIQSMTVIEHPGRFVAFACEELLETMPYRWIGMLFGDEEHRLKKLASRFIVAGEPTAPESTLRELAGKLLADADVADAMKKKTLVLDPASNPDRAEFAPLGQPTLVQPISGDGVMMGLLIAGQKQGDDTAASSVDMKLLAATASHTAIFIENAALYEDLNAMFLGTLEALTASIDAKDRYTSGHSQRVALLTRQLARRMGMDDHTVSRMWIAGLVHDIGKIGVPEAVLTKPGRLTDEEFAEIKKHPEIGYRILEDIPQLKDILPGVLYHHERWDGRGYPSGLVGEDIPVIARLIALADSFDAMSSTRTYRASLSREQVLEEILHCAGSQFDPALAPEFVKLDFSEFDRLVAEHQAIERARMGGDAA
jgi:HD-GYP domain-containing protein (c-di-GMP phosphodiesterase class II)